MGARKAALILMKNSHFDRDTTVWNYHYHQRGKVVLEGYCKIGGKPSQNQGGRLQTNIFARHFREFCDKKQEFCCTAVGN